MPTREVDTTLGYSVNGALFPTVVNTKDYTGTVVATTNYTYDEGAYLISTASSAPNHSDTLVTGNRGNLTTVSQCCGWNGTSNVSLISHVWYDDAGTVQKIQDANTNKTLLSAYDPTDTFPTTIQLPNTTSSTGAIVSHFIYQTYDPSSGQLASVTDQNGQVTTYTFDQYGRPYQVLFSNGGSQVTLQTTTYPSAWETDVSVLQSPGVFLSGVSMVDGFGRPIQSVQGGVSTETSYDSQGRVSQVTNAHTGTPSQTDGKTTYQHDELGRVTVVTMPNTYSTSYTYIQNTVTVEDPLQHRREMVSDAFGNTIMVLEPDSSENLTLATNYQYNWQNQLVQVVQHGGVSDPNQWRKRIFSYDGVGRLISQTTPEAGIQSFAYDNNGNLWKTQNLGNPSNPQSQNNPNNTTQYTYDALNRMLTATIAGGPTYTYNYDESTDFYGHGLLTSVSTNGSSVSTSWQHDALGRTTSTAYCMPSNCGSTGQPAYTVGSTFDFQGNQTSLTYPSGRQITWSYDLLNRPTNETFAQFGNTPVNTPYVSNLSYTPGGQVQQATIGTAVQFGATYDVDSNLASLAYVARGTPIVEKTYSWDKNASNLTSITDSAAGRTQQYFYDQLDRLNSFQDSGMTANACNVSLLPGVSATTQSYSLDSWGNLMFPGSGFQYSSGSNNQIAAYESNYDGAGNLLSDGTNNYQYRADGLMTNSNSSTYIYDALGQRVRKNGSSSNEYIYFGGQLLAMRDPSTGAWTDRIYGPTGALATVPGTQSGTPTYRVTNHLGSLNYLLNASGNIVGTSNALPYGQVTNNNTSDTFPFTDHERDADGTDATQYRHYSSAQGRWLSPDPSNGSYNLLDPQSLNRYSYLKNRPMATVDRLGLDGDGDGNDGDDGDDGWDELLNDLENIFCFGFCGGGGGGSGDGGGGGSYTPPPKSGLPTVASDGLPATTQPNGGGAYIAETLWADPSSPGFSASSIVDFSPGNDIDGTAVIPTPTTLSFGGMPVTVEFSYAGYLQGIKISAQPQGCEGCYWAQVFARTGDGARRPTKDGSGLGPTFGVQTRGTNYFYDVAINGPGQTGTFSATTLLGRTNFQTKSFVIVGSMSYGYRLGHNTIRMWPSPRLSTPQEVAAALKVLRENSPNWTIRLAP